MNIEKTERLTQLFEFYGILLTKTQRQYFEDYYLSDLSLAEIAENAQVSRQAIFDNIKRSVKLLENYEEKLHLAANFAKLEQELSATETALAQEDYLLVQTQIAKMKEIIEEN